MKKHLLQILAVASITILAFQNCGKLSPGDSSADGRSGKLCTPNGEPYEGLTACGNGKEHAMPSNGTTDGQFAEDNYYPSPEEASKACLSEIRDGIQYRLVMQEVSHPSQEWILILSRSDGFSTEALWRRDTPQFLVLNAPIPEISQVQLRMARDGRGALKTIGATSETTFALVCK